MIKFKKGLWAAILLLAIPFSTVGQEKEIVEATAYRIEAFGSAATGSNTPFWMASNRYGIVPLDAGNGYLEAGVFHHRSFGKGFHWSAGLELAGASPRYKKVFIQQLYANLSYKVLQLSIGSQERYASLWDRDLGSGDLVQSSNARPIPEINLSFPRFVAIPLTNGWLHFKGDFAVGRSFDTDYLRDFSNAAQVYSKDVLWHHKSLLLKINDSYGSLPLSFTFGVRHWAQWGGDHLKNGKQPQSLKDFARIVLGREGGAGATQSDQVNVLGNHFGTYDFKLSYTQEDWAAHAYYQHYFDDKSGMEFKNKTDGLWGLELQTGCFPWLRKVVLEYVDTRDQSGPFHFINFDRTQHSGRGGGSDNYYNNGEYTTGVSYFNRSLGSPLVLSPEYNEGGQLGFPNNRIKDWHIGLEGSLSGAFSYRFLLTLMNSWGQHATPFLQKKEATACLLDINYQPSRLRGWNFKGSFAVDQGKMLGNSAGFSLSVSKRGLLKEW